MNVAYNLTLRRTSIASRSINNRIKMASSPGKDQIKSPGSGGKRARDIAVPEIEDCGFESDELPKLRTALLEWYDSNHRILPWRRNPHSKLTPETITQATANNILPAPPTLAENDFIYYVWVCEIMSQQTQVSRAAEYFRKWVAKWPTVTDLAVATLEEVNEMWAGLGYYRRAKFLHEGAKKIVQPPFNGSFPHTSEELSKAIPGVGPYTAAAIASIACGEKVAVVDGNVIRVMARLRAVSGDPRSGAGTKLFNKLANEAIDPERPGDFNQAVMELGATVCVPNTQPSCTTCPVSAWCVARKAEMCSGGFKVTEYPTKVQKASKREETVAVSIVEAISSGISGTVRKESMYLLVQRPKDNGLLAGLWEFPLRQVGEDDGKTKRQLVMDDYLQSIIVPDKMSIVERKELGQAVHVFSHIRMTMKAEKVKIKLLEEKEEKEKEEEEEGGEEGGEKEGPSLRWLTLSELKEAGLSSGVKKVLKMMEDDEKKQKTGISKFFTAKKK